MPLQYTPDMIKKMTPEERQMHLKAIDDEIAKVQGQQVIQQAQPRGLGFSGRGAVLGGLKALIGESPDLTPKTTGEDLATFIAKEQIKSNLKDKTIPTGSVPPGMWRDSATGKIYKLPVEEITEEKVIPTGDVPEGFWRDEATGKVYKLPEPKIDKTIPTGETPEGMWRDPATGKIYKVPEQKGLERSVKVTSLAPAQSKVIDDTIASISVLDNISNKAKTGDYKTGYMSAYSQTAPFHKARISMFGTPETAQFKSDLTDAQATYMTAKTGAQRGFKEIAWLEAAMPSGDMPPEQVVAVADRARERQELNLRNLLMNAQKSGKDISSYEDTLNQLIEKYPLDKYPFGMTGGMATTSNNEIQDPEYERYLKAIGAQ